MRTLPGPGPLEALRFVQDPYRAHERWRARYGDLFRVPLPTGPMVMVARPDGVQAVLRAPPDQFGIWLKHTVVPAFGERSSFTTEGEAHRRHRRALFAALAQLPSQGPAIRAAVEELCAGEGPVELGALGLAVALRVLVRALCAAPGEAAPEDLEALAQAYGRSVVAVGAVAAFALPWLQGPHWPPWRAFVRLRSALYARLAALPATAPLLALRERLSPEETADELVTLLLAGHESTARSIAWALGDLLEQPPLLARLRAEMDPLPLDDDAAVLALPLLKAVVLESLRLRTVILQINRRCLVPFELLGHAIPAGTTLSLVSHLLHRDRALYPRPDAFLPERFLQTPPDPFAFLPFGGGARRCPGAAFATAELQLVLFHLLRRCELVPQARWSLRGRVEGLVLAPEVPMVVEVRLRVS